MKKLIAISASVVLAILLSARSADAGLIDLGIFEISIGGSPSAEADWIEGQENLDFELTYLNKWDGAEDAFDEDGAVDGGHFSVDPGGEAIEQDITWDLTGTGFEALYVLVKDGTAGGGNTFYHLYEVESDQAIVGSGTVTINGEKAISHISWYGDATGVPDGGMTLSLLGVALVGLGALRRKFNA